MSEQDLNPTGLQINLDALISAQAYWPDPEHSRSILATIDRIPVVLFWLDHDAWETVDGEIVTEFDSWVYLH